MSTTKRRKTELLQEARTFREANSTTDVAIRQFLSALDCPRALTVWLLYKNNEHSQLVDLECSPHWYNNAFGFRDAYTATTYLSKSNFLKLPIAKDVAAYEKFQKFETLCKQTNSRFIRPASDPLNKGSNVWLLNTLKRKIAIVLGDYSADEFVDEANWGPGVTTLIKGEHVSAVNKFHAERGITRDLYPLVSNWFAVAYPCWSAHLTRSYGEKWADYQVGNRVVTVPKNSKTDRVIAIEPGINLWFQKAIGSMIRRRLNRFGIDLNTQERNQSLARLASKTGHLATVDFSSASDSISLELIREVLPPRWFQLLDTCRSKCGYSNDGLIRWEKFSSMGNGFTFELESLVFFAAAQAVTEYLNLSSDEISVFGDDVILPSPAFVLFTSFSEFLGFKVNTSKSFHDGYFRESCGSHYYDGVDCKPIFLKERLRNVEAFYKLANNVRNLAHRRNSYYGCDRSLLECWHHLYYRVPEPLRLSIPNGKGDSGFASNFDESAPIRARNGIEGYFYTSLSTSEVTQSFDETGLLLSRLWVQSLQEHGNTYALRGRTRRTVTRSLVSQWYNLGPWI